MKRLFGNENARHVQTNDDWEELGNTARRNRAAAAAAPGAIVVGPKPTFPYPKIYSVAFGTAQAGTLWIPIAGYVLSFWDSTNLTDVVNVRFGLSEGDLSQPATLPFRPGHALGVGDFTWLGLTWAQIVGATGTLAIFPKGVTLDENR